MWVATQIVTCSDIRLRAKTVTAFVKIAQVLFPPSILNLFLFLRSYDTICNSKRNAII